MDLGVFLRSRAHLGAWVLTPLLLIVALHFSATSYARRTERRLRDSRALMAAMPQLEARRQAADEVVGRFSVTSQGQADATEVVRTRIARGARECGFVVNSLSVEKKDAEGASASPRAAESVLVSVGGDGSLAAVIGFLSAVQCPECLVSIESASVRAINIVTEPLYAADFVFRYYLIAQ